MAMIPIYVRFVGFFIFNLTTGRMPENFNSILHNCPQTINRQTAKNSRPITFQTPDSIYKTYNIGVDYKHKKCLDSIIYSQIS